MGTIVSLQAFHDDAEYVERVFQRAERRVAELEKILSDYDPKSETSRLSERATAGPVTVSDELFAVLAASEDWYRRTDGAFDASLGALTKLWRKHRRAGRIPSEPQIAKALAVSGWRHVELDRQAQTVRFLVDGLQLDFGGIGKGYVLDEVFLLLDAAGLRRSLVNISGNMRCGDAPPGRDAWRISIAPLERGGEPLRTVRLVRQAIATSGDLWQYIAVDGRRHSHILSPKTGWGVLGPVAATAIAPTATDADALATAACILPFEATAEILAEHPRIHFLLAARAEGDIDLKATSGFPK